MDTASQPPDLEELFVEKYGAPGACGPAPEQRRRYGYVTPADHYEALAARLIAPGMAWIDIGGGVAPFPDNARLSRRLSDRARRLVVVDPSDNISRNLYAHERAKCAIEDYQCDELLDIATLRMVVEHVSDPVRCVAALRRLVRPDGRVVVFTVNQWSLTALAARLTPFRLHHPIKRMFWGGDDRDTFPTVYRMNTRGVLRRLFHADGFVEESFGYLDDLAVFGHFRVLSLWELWLWRLIKLCGLRYPENCLLGVYRRL